MLFVVDNPMKLFLLSFSLGVSSSLAGQLGFLAGHGNLTGRGRLCRSLAQYFFYLPWNASSTKMKKISRHLKSHGKIDQKQIKMVYLFIAMRSYTFFQVFAQIKMVYFSFLFCFGVNHGKIQQWYYIYGSQCCCVFIFCKDLEADLTLVCLSCGQDLGVNTCIEKSTTTYVLIHNRHQTMTARTAQIDFAYI